MERWEEVNGRPTSTNLTEKEAIQITSHILKIRTSPLCNNTRIKSVSFQGRGEDNRETITRNVTSPYRQRVLRRVQEDDVVAAELDLRRGSVVTRRAEGKGVGRKHAMA